MSQHILTAGYAGHSPEDLQRLVKQHQAQVFDIRFNPRARDPRWNRRALEHTLGIAYQHMPEFGNSAYKTGGIELVDFDGGVQKIVDCAAPVVILLCACKNPTDCHRTVIGHRLKELGFEVTEYDWSEL